MEIADNHKVQVRNTLIESVFANVTTAFNELKWDATPTKTTAASPSAACSKPTAYSKDRHGEAFALTTKKGTACAIPFLRSDPGEARTLDPMPKIDTVRHLL